MKQTLLSLAIALGAMLTTNAGAFEANHVRVVEINSGDVNGNTWVKISGMNNCPNPHEYFLIERWDNAGEPIQTFRKQMYQLAVMALAAGKEIRVLGATCLSDSYIYAQQVIVYE